MVAIFVPKFSGSISGFVISFLNSLDDKSISGLINFQSGILENVKGAITVSSGQTWKKGSTIRIPKEGIALFVLI